MLLTLKLFFAGDLNSVFVFLFVDMNRFQNDPKDINIEPDDFAAVGG